MGDYVKFDVKKASKEELEKNQKWFPPKPIFDELNMGWEGYFEASLDAHTRYKSGPFKILHENTFNAWWDKEIVPLFENAQVVYGFMENESAYYWGSDKDPSDGYKALIIKIEPIEEKEEELKYQYVDSGMELNGERLYKKVVEK